MPQPLSASVLAEERLSPREAEVFELVGRAMTDKEIARELSLSPRTVQIHVGSVRRKLNCKNKIAVALLAHGIEV